MTEIKNLGYESSVRAFHYDDLSHALDTADYYQKQKARGADKEERHETLRHLAVLARRTLDREGIEGSRAVRGRIREALRLTRGA